MFYYIKGTIEDSGKDYVVIDNNGIGYKVFVSSATLSNVTGNKQVVKLYTYYHVREDLIALYGFLSREELDMFELLISVSGVGPKAALAVLSTLSPSKLGLSIIGGDTKSLTAVPGIGSKTAHRIILELKDKIDTEGIMELANDRIPLPMPNDPLDEVVHALMGLGYTAVEANSALKKIDTTDKDTEKIIKEALKNLMK